MCLRFERNAKETEWISQNSVRENEEWVRNRQSKRKREREGERERERERIRNNDEAKNAERENLKFSLRE